MNTLRPRTELSLITLFAVLWHGLWALIVRLPTEWDGWYYLAVAKHIAAGEGAITQSLWNLTWLPERLPMPADSYWMPLPSRVLVPGLWLWPDWGEKLVLIGLASAWVPVTWALADAAKLSPATRRIATWCVAWGAFYTGLLEQPDCFALVGLLGALALLSVARQNIGGAVLCAVGLALARNDGFLLGLTLAFGFTGPKRIAVGLAGPLTFGLWTLRNLYTFGPGYWDARALAAHTADYYALFDGINQQPLSLFGRLTTSPLYTPDLVRWWLFSAMIVLLPGALWQLWQMRTAPWIRVVALWWLVIPVLQVVLVPVVCHHGALTRTGIAVVVGLTLAGCEGTRAWLVTLATARGYHPAFLPTLLVGSIALTTSFLGFKTADFQEDMGEACATLDAQIGPGPVFTGNPLAVEVQCGRPGVMITNRLSAAQIEDLAQRYGIVGAYAPSVGPLGEDWFTPASLPLLLPDALILTPDIRALRPASRPPP